ncbi:MAG TPA: CHRD domain-containing protein [Candidatus Margulisiibacteriota bacterium]|nr:CHRD domain-containing protein [Candidatus Margulisiibacteriota bacterium]
MQRDRLVPAVLCTKTVTGQLQRKFSPPGGKFEDFTPAPVAGQDLTEDTLCYQIKCTDNAPTPPNPSLQVFDQFGGRTVSKLQPYLLCGPAGQGTPPTTFNIALSGSQETPPNNSTATGSCTLVLNAAQTTLTIDCTHTVANTILGHIHKAPAGTPGPIVFPFSNPASPVHEVWNLTPSDVSDLLAGNLYVNIHSTAFVAGEIRGQIR